MAECGCCGVEFEIDQYNMFCNACGESIEGEYNGSLESDAFYTVQMTEETGGTIE